MSWSTLSSLIGSQAKRAAVKKGREGDTQAQDGRWAANIIDIIPTYVLQVPRHMQKSECVDRWG